MRVLDDNTIKTALARLGERLGTARRIEILIVGGAAGVLIKALPAAWTTADVDAIDFRLPQDRDLVLDTAAVVGRELSLPADWLNDWSTLYAWTLPDDWKSRRVPVGAFGMLDVICRQPLRPDRDEVHRPPARRPRAPRAHECDRGRSGVCPRVSRCDGTLVPRRSLSDRGRQNRHGQGVSEELGDQAMKDELLHSVAARWTRLGAMLNVKAAGRTPDIERLLLDTARVCSAHSRLFVLAASWLALYGDYVARHRLAHLVRRDLEVEYQSVLGLLLDWARENGVTNGSRFNLAIRACAPAASAQPLFDVERRTPALARLAEQRASSLSRKWGRWTIEFEIRTDAIRPAEWIAEHNPSLVERALTGGDLLASVLAECRADAHAIQSEAELARRCGASRPAIREAIRRLQLAGRIRSIPRGRSHAIELTNRQVA